MDSKTRGSRGPGRRTEDLEEDEKLEAKRGKKLRRET
jgi:hypothetical protein